VKGAKTMNDDATIVVTTPDAGNSTSLDGDDMDATHESTAPASSTCKANDDCPRGANGHINRCIEGSCKDIGITAVEGVKSGVNLAAAAPSQRLQAAAEQSPALAVALVAGGMALVVGAAVSVRRSVRRGYTELESQVDV